MRPHPVALFAALLALLIPTTALADAGDPDPAFDTDGIVHPKIAATEAEQTGDLGDGSGEGTDIVVTWDGFTAILDGETGQVIKRNPAGDATTGFGGGDGIVDVFQGVPDGNDYTWTGLVAAGTQLVVVGKAVGATTEMAVARLNSDGSADTSFGGDGVVTIQPSTSGAMVSEALTALDTGDGKLVVAGRAADASGSHFAVARLDGAGALDPTVGDTDDGTPDGPGWVVTPILTADSAINALGVVGQTLVAGGTAASGNWALAKYDLADLELNTGFDDDGWRLLPVPSTGGGLHELVVAPSGDMVAGGLAGDSATFTVAHLLEDGELDASDLDPGTDGVQDFGDGGIASVELAGAQFGGMVTADDSTVVAGSYEPSAGTTDWVWIRWDALGDPDAYWGEDGNGIAAGGRSGADRRLNGIAADADGQLFAAGTDNPVAPDWAPDHTPALLKIDEEIAAPAVNTSDRPTIGTTEAVDGNTLTPEPGTWTGRFVEYSYTWKRCDDAGTTNCATVGTADTPLVLGDGDVGKWVAPVYTGENAVGESTAEGEYARVMARPPVFTAAPAIAQSGTVPVGTTLTVGSDGDYGDATDPEVTYQWEECEKTAPAWIDVPNPLTAENSPQCRTLSGEEGDSYVVEQGDRNLRLQVYVSNTHLGVGSGGSNDASWSATVAVAGAATGTPPANTAAPAIEPGGSVTEGDTLKAASNGTWTGTQPIAFSRQWQRCGGTADAPTGCAGIAGATGDDYATTGADVGKVVRLRITAQNSAGSAAADSSGRTVNAKPAPAPGPAPAPKPAPPALPAKKPTYITTLDTTPMPEVRGKIADKAIAMIEQAGIYADVTVDTQARSKPLTLNGKKLQPGQVHTQSTSAGTGVTSSITRKHKIKLVVEAGKPGIKACQDSEFRQDLKGVTLEQAWELLEAKRCDGKVNLNFKVAGSEDEPEVSGASKDGKELKVTVTLPKSHAEMDLFPTKSQGAFPSDPMPSFGVDDWALTADVQNIFGIRVYDRYIGDGRTNPGARVGVGAEVYLDADRVGEEDDVRKTRPDTGNAAIFSKFRPTKAGTAYYLVTMEDAAGQKIFGYGHFKVKQRSGTFSTIAGETYDVSGGRATRSARAAAAGGPVARAASVNQLFSWVQGLFQSTPLQNLAAGAKTAGEGLISMAKKSAGAVQFALGSISATTAQLIRAQAANVVASGGGNVVAAGGANVVSAGGANVVAAGGANVVSAGGANVVSAGGANVVAAGGMNLLGQAKLVNGTGSLRAIPNDSRLLSDNGLGLISDNGLGLQNVSKVIAPSEAAPVVAAGGGNLIGTAAGNVVAAGGLNLIGQAGGN